MKCSKQACLLVRIARLRDSRDWYPLQTPDNDVECLQKLVPVLTFTVVAARLEFSLTSLVLSLEVNKTTKKPACLVAKKPESAKSSVLKIFPMSERFILCLYWHKTLILEIPSKYTKYSSPHRKHVCNVFTVQVPFIYLLIYLLLQYLWRVCLI